MNRSPATPWALVRQALGLPQRTWAFYIGVSVGQIRHLERGRRAGKAQWPRLARLLPLLSPGAESPSALTLPPLPLVVVEPPVSGQPASYLLLHRAQQQAAQTAANLRIDLLARHQQAAITARQQAAVALLETPDPTDRAPTRTQRLLEALRREIETHTGTGAALDPVRLAHDTLRLWLLETEAAILARWLQQES